jgi:PAS domain S-box-containing protein
MYGGREGGHVRDEDKTRPELIAELRDLRRRLVARSPSAPEEHGLTVEESQDRYRNLFENASEGILILDIGDERLRFANEAAAQLFGHPLDILRGFTLADLQLPDELGRTRALFAEMVAGTREAATNLPCVDADGLVIYVDVTATVGIVGGRESLILFLRDVSERKRAEDETAKFRTLVDQVTTGVVLVDLQGRIEYANPWFSRMHEWPPESVRGAPISVFRSQEHMDRCAEMLVEMTTEGSATTREGWHQRRDGTIFPVLMNGTLIPATREQQELIACTFVDISEAKEAELLVQRAKDEVEHARDDMLSIINRLGKVSVLTDPEGRLTFLSEEGLRLFDLGPDDALGRHWDTVLPVTDDGRRRLAAARAQPEAARPPVDLELRTAKGRRTRVQARVLDDPRDHRRSVFFLEDVTELYDLRQRLGEASRFHGMIGRSAGMQRVFQRIREIAAVDWTVLIHGETGAGKELVARALHGASPRGKGPFVAVNCAGLSDALLSSQLFGHRRGSFTGATADQQGVFEAAQGGTLFLDEIGDISPAMQTSLLRVLESKEITRVGDTRPRAVDVRVVTATHRDLGAEVAAGRFRADLLYRIRIARVDLPPLRDRQEDIPLLAAEFLRGSTKATGKTVDEVSEDAIRVLMEHPWPGNVRELRSAVDYAVLHCGGTCVRALDLPPELLSASAIALPDDAETPEGADERTRILDALRRSGGKRAAAARLLGISRATFYRRLDDLEITLEDI